MVRFRGFTILKIRLIIFNYWILRIIQIAEFIQDQKL